MFTGWWLWKATEGIENTRKHRSAIKSAILQELREKNKYPVLGTDLDSHCGKTVLSVTVGGQGEVIRHYRYDIDTGRPVSGEWWDSLSLENLDLMPAAAEPPPASHPAELSPLGAAPRHTAARYH